MSKEKINVGKEPVYDARKLGYGKMGVLWFSAHVCHVWGNSNSTTFNRT